MQDDDDDDDDDDECHSMFKYTQQEELHEATICIFYGSFCADLGLFIYRNPSPETPLTGPLGQQLLRVLVALDVMGFVKICMFGLLNWNIV